MWDCAIPASVRPTPWIAARTSLPGIRFDLAQPCYAGESQCPRRDRQPLAHARRSLWRELRPVSVEKLGGIVAKAVLERTGLDPALVEDMVFAQSYANSETPCVGRWIALDAGLPIETPGLQTDRRCGGGLQAIVTAAMMVQTGARDVVMAGGVESMSNIEHYTTDLRWGKRSGSTQLYDRLDRGRSALSRSIASATSRG